ncbi:MAG: hypothetical protein U0547_02200 [Dehalococcoidia bacterium]
MKHGDARPRGLGHALDTDASITFAAVANSPGSFTVKPSRVLASRRPESFAE